MSDTYAYDHNLPCLNPHCKSNGRPHPNCKCYSGGEQYADGGQVLKEYYCKGNIPHKQGCEYFVDGGVATNPQQLTPQPAAPEDPTKILGHASIHHGLLGLMKNVGHAALVKSDKHNKLLADMQAQHAWRQSPNEEIAQKTMGNRLGDHLADNNHEKAAEHMQGHPMIGNISKEKLTPIIGTLARPMIENEPNPEALRSSVDYLHSAIKGNNRLDTHVSELFSGKMPIIKSDMKAVDSLKNHLDELDLDPEKALETGGTLSHYLPNHSTALGTLTAAATNYFKTLKPMRSQGAPLDTLPPFDKAAEQKYNRQLEIAQNPMLVLQNAKNGTLQAQDLTTLHTLYPGLTKTLSDKLNNELISNKSRGNSLTYAQKRGISMLMGSPLDSTMTQPAMQAIIQANAPKNPAAQPKTAGNQKATKTAVETSEKVNKLYQTTLQSRQINKKD